MNQFKRLHILMCFSNEDSKTGSGCGEHIKLLEKNQNSSERETTRWEAELQMAGGPGPRAKPTLGQRVPVTAGVLPHRPDGLPCAV